MWRSYQIILKEGNGDQEYLRFSDIQDKNFEFMCSSIALDKVKLDCAETVQTKPTRNNSGFIAY